jgi:hypothetical protein
MSPELMIDEARSATLNASLTDVYAYGIMTFAIMTSTKPFDFVCNERKLGIWGLVSWVD